MLDVPRDIAYEARADSETRRCRTNVWTITKVLNDWPGQLRTTTDLLAMFSEQSVVGGFASTFDKVLLTDILEIDIVEEWGSLVKISQDLRIETGIGLCFFFLLSLHTAITRKWMKH